jgi:hypothetical protein
MSNDTTYLNPQQVSDLSQRPALGEWCIVKREAHKHHYMSHFKRITEWTAYPFNRQPLRAMYIGSRVVRGGETTYHPSDDWGYGESPTFKITRSYCVWLFVTDERSAPFYVFPQDVDFLDGAE